MTKVLYVDETGSENSFIVAGLFVDDVAIDQAYKSLKKELRSMKLSNSDRQQVCLEFKSILLDRHFQRLKYKMFNHLNQYHYDVVYGVYKINPDLGFKQAEKEDAYLALLTKIVESINGNIVVVYDGFNDRCFDDKIIKTVGALRNVENIVSGDSRKIHGLQFIDNICSTLRHYVDEDDKNFYQWINGSINRLD